MMIRLFAISRAALAHAVAASLFATAVAAQDVTTDIGTLDKETAEKAFPAKPPYSPYAGRNFPTRPLSFLKIKSARIDDASRTRLVW
jgi:hypothetical protein